MSWTITKCIDGRRNQSKNSFLCLQSHVSWPLSPVTFHLSLTPTALVTPTAPLCTRVQCVANIRIFEYIRILIDEYIHSFKYSWIFPTQIYLDIHSKLFPCHEYTERFIRNTTVWLQQTVRSSCWSSKFNGLTQHTFKLNILF